MPLRSSEPYLTELLEEGSNIYVFGERRLLESRYIAHVQQVEGDRVRIYLDPDDLKQSRIRRGQEVMLGLAVAARRMHFRAAVTALSCEADGTLVVSPPKRIEKWPRRSYTRARMKLHCQAVLAGPDGAPLHLTGTTVDLSASGVRVEFEGPPPRAALVSAEGELSLCFPGYEPIRCRCAVTREGPASDPGEANAFTLGIRYVDLPESTQMWMHLMVLRTTARRFLRATTALRCQVEAHDGPAVGHVYRGVTENVSAGGLLARLRGKVDLRAGDRVHVGLALPARYVVAEDAEIVRVHPQGTESIVALDFRAIGELDTEAVLRFVVGRIRGLGDGARPAETTSG